MLLAPKVLRSVREWRSVSAHWLMSFVPSVRLRLDSCDRVSLLRSRFSRGPGSVDGVHDVVRGGLRLYRVLN